MTETNIERKARKSIIIYSVLGIFLIGTIVFLVSIIPLYSRLKGGVQSNLVHAAKVRSMAVDEYISRAKDITLQVTSRTLIRKKLEAYNRGEITPEELIEFTKDKLSDAMKLSEEVAGISRISTKGKLLVEVGLPLPERDLWPIPSENSREVTVYGPISMGGETYILVAAHIFGERATDGREPEFFAGRNHFELYPNEENRQIFQNVVDTGEPCFAYEKPFEYAEHPERGVTYWDWSLQPVKEAGGKVTGLVFTLLNVTERRRMEDALRKSEEQLRHAQKMEAMGRFAGGITHDFNNILTAIIGYGSLVQMKLKEDDPVMNYVKQILASSEKAANLTKSLLAFSRKQIISPKPVNLNEIIKGMEKLFRRLIGEDIGLRIIPADVDLTVMADIGQIEQVMMNLATNARDAMPDGGHLTMETSVVEIGEEYLRRGLFERKGRYALLTVTDTGIGMDEKTRERIFEPFFTTKEVGKGTGLGLAIVYGIIKQHNGYINVYSEPGRGTTFRMYLPLIEGEIKEIQQDVIPAIKGGTETLLLAEDDTDVRSLIKDILESYGYKVIDAADGEDALRLFHKNREDIRMAILDVVMPKKNGREVYEEIKRIVPDIKVLFMSGYTADIISEKGILKAGLDFISKPVSPKDLLKLVREILDR